MTEMSPYRCVSCTKQLFVGRGENVILHACGSCRGIWLDSTDAGKVMRGWIGEKSLALAKMVDQATERDAGGYRDAPAAARALACPHGECPLHRSDVAAGNDSVVVDMCEHGMWFDQGELTRIAELSTESRKRLGAVGERSLRLIAVTRELSDVLQSCEDATGAGHQARLRMLINDLLGLLNLPPLR